MPVTYNIDLARKVIRTTCSRPLTLPEVLDHFRALKDDPACSGHLDVLLNVTDADTVPASNQFREVNAELRAIRDKVQFGLCAVVAGRDAMFGMMRVFEVLAADYFAAIRVFREPADAETWLVSQPTAPDPVP